MQMSPTVRKFALTAHVATSVGWLGAVAAFFALTVVGLTAKGIPTAQAAYLAMNIIGEFVILPLGVAALITGIIQSLGTPWGLFRHYWVFTKFILTVIATALLVLHQFMAVAVVADRVRDAGVALPDVAPLGRQLFGDAAGALVLLLATTALSIYKPWGRISVESSARTVGNATSRADGRMPNGIRLLLAVFGGLIIIILLIHLAGGGLGPHHR